MSLCTLTIPRIIWLSNILLCLPLFQLAHSVFHVTSTKQVGGNGLKNPFDIRTKCNAIPGLTREQVQLCYQATDVTLIALDGLDLAIHECQSQFRAYRWNCSSLSKKSRNPHSSNLLKRGYRESAFAYAISSAGVAYTVARACSQGKILSCSCDPSYHPKRKPTPNDILQQQHNTTPLSAAAPPSHSPNANDPLLLSQKSASQRRRGPHSWKWGGCSHNLKYGIEFSKLFLDVREKGADLQSLINRHNNQAGRRAVVRNMEVKCKCHGLSGSCTVKTCWKSAPSFRVIGNILKRQFKRALLVDQANNNGPLLLRKTTTTQTTMMLLKAASKRQQSRSPRKTKAAARDGRPNSSSLSRGKRGGGGTSGEERIQNSLLYYQKSPNFCEKDLSSDIPGTSGRRCNRTSTGTDGCDSMCCGRGYNLMIDHRTGPCRCQFKWCCNVKCEQCDSDEWISVCN